jgi:hypothetical protein
MYDLNSAFNQAQGNSEESSREFKPGVEICRMRLKNKNEIQFRILPSFGSANITESEGVVQVTNPRGWDYFRNVNDPNQGFTPWARVLNSYNFLGHGQGGSDGGRITIVAPRSFGGDGQQYDPVEELRKEARRDPMWKYLTEDLKTPDGKDVIERAALPYMSTELIFNMIDLGDLQKGVQLGILSKSGMTAVLGDKGLANQRNFNCTDEMAAANPMLLWNCGDLTNPEGGPVLRLRQEQGKGRYASYVVEVVVNPQGTGFQTYPINEQLLEARHVLDDPTSFMTKYTPQQIVNMLIKVLDGVNPQTGEHELVLLHRVFGGKFDVPEPPANRMPIGPAAGVGFTAPPAVPGAAAGGIPGLASPAPAAGNGIPGMAPPAAVPPPGAQSIPGMNAGSVPPAGNPPAQQAPASANATAQPPQGSATAPTGQPAPNASTASPSNVPGGAIKPTDKTFMNMLQDDANK